MNYESELKVAVEAVRKACGLCMRVQSSLVTEDEVTKKDDSPVTVADFGAQAVICHELKGRGSPRRPHTRIHNRNIPGYG
jgi:3'(2'), 5'-bisphosphate nucleotidase